MEENEKYMPQNEDASSNKKEEVTPQAENRENNPLEKMPYEEENQEMIWLSQKVNEIRAKMGEFIIGQQVMVDLLMTGIFSAGHLLLEGVPGVAKTLSAKVLSKSLDIDFSRIQFTPDLMPSDVLGTSVFNMKRSEFYFKKGPIFSNMVLIDEINRAPAKTQAALMEVMEEGQVSIDGETYKMPPPFFVVATQNPVEQEGTYKLPEAQLDRFMFKLIAEYPDVNEEEAMLKRFSTDFYGEHESHIVPVINADTLVRYRKTV